MLALEFTRTNYPATIGAALTSGNGPGTKSPTRRWRLLLSLARRASNYQVSRLLLHLSVHRSAAKLLSHRARHRSQRQSHQCKTGGVTAARPALICEKLSVTAKPPSHTKTGGADVQTSLHVA